MNKLFLLIPIIILWALDTIFTIIFVSKFGMEAEANPLMRLVLMHGGNSGFVAVKALALAPIISVYKHVPPWLYYIMIGILIPIAYFGGKMAFGT